MMCHACYNYVCNLRLTKQNCPFSKITLQRKIYTCNYSELSIIAIIFISLVDCFSLYYIYFYKCCMLQWLSLNCLKWLLFMILTWFLSILLQFVIMFFTPKHWLYYTTRFQWTLNMFNVDPQNIAKMWQLINFVFLGGFSLCNK